MQEDIYEGKHWYIALLEAIGRWTVAEETVDGRLYRYLIAGEAFDWLLLAERLCRTVEDYIPEKELERLLFYGKAPLNLTPEEFQAIIGESKYRQHLNFFYGITVEDALYLSVLNEIRKERMATVFNRDADYDDEVYTRIYGETRTELLDEFRSSKGYERDMITGLTESREFTYWLFRYRVENCDRSRVASDTKKAMEFLKEQYISILKKSEV
jgi:hypothetical protein